MCLAWSTVNPNPRPSWAQGVPDQQKRWACEASLWHHLFTPSAWDLALGNPKRAQHVGWESAATLCHGTCAVCWGFSSAL